MTGVSAHSRAPHIRAHRIVHAGSLQRRIAKGKAARLDDMRGRAKTGGSAQYRADIAGDIRLKQGDFHGRGIAARGVEIEGRG
jgi:hypothetical protein